MAFLFIGILALLIRTATQKEMVIEFGICKKHRSISKLLFWIGLPLAVVGLIVAFAAISFQYFAVGIISLVAMVSFGYVAMKGRQMLKVHSIDFHHAYFKGCSPGFLQQLPPTQAAVAQAQLSRRK